MDLRSKLKIFIKMLVKVRLCNISDTGHLELEFKDLFARYTNDVIANSAFGIKINSLKDRNNEFITMGKEATNFKGIVIVKFFFMVVCSSLMKVNVL